MPNSPSPTRDPEPIPRPVGEPKWWAHSLTIWGALITALSTVLPALLPLIGINLPPEVARLLGDAVLQFGQAAAGLAGTILTIYGRGRAAAPLERRPVTLNV